MANNQIRVNLMFQAETQKARNSLKQLQADLNAITTASANGEFKLTNKVIEGQKAAIQLKNILNECVNMDTGKFDLSKFSHSLKKGGTDLKQMATQLQQLGPEGSRAFMSLAQSIVQAEIPTKRVNAQLAQMAKTIKDTARWQISSSIIHGFQGALENAYGYAQDLNRSLNDIRIVTGYNEKYMANFAVEANKAAKALSATTKEYTEASLIYFQQGLSDEQVAQRTATTIKLANVTGRSAEDVSSYMTAVWNNFDDGTKSLEYYADAIAALGAATASSSEEIATGLQKFSAVANTVGLSYEYATAALATVTAQTRESAETVGTAFKTIFARLESLSLGETLDDETTMTKYSQALAKVGVNIKTANGQLKDMDTIIDELGQKWDSIGKDQQIALAQTVAGMRQYNNFIALMDNYDTFTANVDIAVNSEGDLSEQAEIYAESWEAARDRATAAAEALYDKILDDKAFIKITDAFTKLLELLDKFIDSAGGLKGVLAMLTGILTRMFNQQIARGMEDMVYNFKSFFGLAKKEAKNLKAEMARMVDTFVLPAGGEYTRAYLAEVDAMKSKINLQIDMAEQQERLTESQRQQLEYQIQILDVITKQKIENAKQQDDLENQLAETKFQLMKKATKEGGDFNEAEDNLKENKQNIAKIIQAGKKGAEGYGKRDETGALAEDGYSDIQTLESALTSTMQDLEGMLGDSGAAIVKYYQDLINDLRDETGRFNDSKAKRVQQRLMNEDEQRQVAVNLALSEQYVSDAGLDEKDAGLIEKRLELEQDLSKAKKKGTQITKKQTEAEEKAQDILKGNTKGTIDYYKAFTDLASATTSLLASFSALENIWDTLQDPDLTSWEKFTSILMSLGTTIPMLITSFNGFISVYESLNKIQAINNITTTIGQALSVGKIFTKALEIEQDEEQIQTLKKLAEAENKETLAKTFGMSVTAAKIAIAFLEYKTASQENKEKAKGALLETLKTAAEAIGIPVTLTAAAANVALGIAEAFATGGASALGGAILTALIPALVAILPYVAIIIAAIAVLVVAIVGLISVIEALKNASPEQSLKFANEQLERMKDNLQEVREEAEALRETIEKYDSAIEKIATLAKGTEAYKEAVREANIAARELIEQYKDLRWSFNADTGLIEFEEGGLEELQKKYDNKVGEAERNVLRGENAVRSAEVRKLIADAVSDGNTYGSYLLNQKSAGIDKTKEKIKTNLTFDKINNAIANDRRNNFTENLDKKYGNTLLGEKLVDMLRKDQENENKKFNQQQIGKQLLAAPYYNIIESIESMVDYRFMYSNSAKNPKLILEGYKNSLPNQLIQEYIPQLQGFNDFVIKSGENLIQGLETLDKVEEFVFSLDETVRTLGLSAIKDKFVDDLQYQAANKLAEIYNNDKAILNPILEKLVESENTFGLLTDTLLDMTGNEFLELAEALDANTQAIIENNKQIVDSLYAESGIYQDSELKNTISSLAAVDMTERGKELYESNYKDKIFGKTDAEIQKEYAEAMGWDANLVKNQNGNKATYYDEEGEEVVVSDETARKFLAEKAAQDEVAKNLDKYVKEANKLADEVTKVTGDIDSALVDNITADIARGRTADLSQLSRKQINDLADSSNKELRKSVKEANKVWEETLKTISVYGQQAISEIENKVDMSQTALLEYGKAVDQVYTYLGEESATQFGAAMSELITDNEDKANEIAGIVASIDWSRGKASVAELEGQLSQIGITIDKNSLAWQQFVYTAESGKMSVLHRDLNSMREALAEIKELTEDIELGSIVSDEDYQKLLKYNGALHSMFQMTAEGYRYIGEDPLSEMNSDYANQMLGDTLGDNERARAGAEAAEGLKFNGARSAKKDVKNIDQAVFDALGINREAVEGWAEQATSSDSTISAAAITNLQNFYDQVAQLRTNAEQGMYDDSRAYEIYASTITTQHELLAQKQKFIDADQMEAYNKQMNFLRAEAKRYLTEYANAMKDLELDLIDSQIDKLQNVAHSSSEIMDLINSQQQSYQDTINETYAEVDKLAEKYAIGPREAGEDYGEYMARIVEMAPQAQEEILELGETISDTMESLEDLDSLYAEALLKHFEDLQKGYDELFSSLDNYSSTIAQYQNVIDLVGAENLNINDAALTRLNKAGQDVSIARVKVARENYETIQRDRLKAEEALQSAIAAGDEASQAQWQETLLNIQEMEQNALDEMNDSWTSALETAASVLEDNTKRIMESFESSMAGIYGTFERMSEVFDQQSELNSQYVADYKKVYELTKLTRNIQDQIDSTENVAAKQSLKELQTEINNLQESGTEMSEYDLEYLQKKYDLRLAEIALEEAQNAKNQVRLQRTASGSWGYVYTQNEDAVNEAQQNYEDKMYELQELSTTYLQDTSASIIETQAAFNEAINEIINSGLTEEEKRQQIEETMSFYQEKLGYLTSEFDKVIANNQGMNNMAQTISDTVLGSMYSLEEFANAGELFEQWQNQLGSLDGEGILGQVSDELSNFEETVSAIFDTAGSPIENYASSLWEAVGNAKEGTGILGAMEELMNATQAYSPDLSNFNELITTLGNYKTVLGELYEDVSDNYSSFVKESLGITIPEAVEEEEAPEQTEEDNRTWWEKIFDWLRQKGNELSAFIIGIIEKVRTGIDDFIKNASHILLAVWTWLGELIPPLKELKFYDEVANALTEFPETVTEITEAVSGNATGFVENVASTLQDIIDNTEGIFEDVAEVIGDIKDYVVKVKESVINWITDTLATDVLKLDILGEGLDIDIVGMLSDWLYSSFDTGGYTGAWGTEGKMAVLHEKELVLNKMDTANILSAVDVVRQIGQRIDLQAAATSSTVLLSRAPTINGGRDALQQEVTIHAEFPHATNHSEIEQAFDTLLNRAAQYTNQYN